MTPQPSKEQVIYCEKCKQQIIPREWAKSGWGEGPHCGVGICSCGCGLPVIHAGDILVDRNFDVTIARSQTYGYDGKNIMSIWRINLLSESSYDRLIFVFRREFEERHPEINFPAP